MKKLLFLLCIAFTPLAFAGDAEVGATKAQPCVACHGEGGNKPISYYPKLAGQSEKYLAYALKSYRDGTRPDPIMAAQAAAMTDADIADLSAYFAAQKGDL